MFPWRRNRLECPVVFSLVVAGSFRSELFVLADSFIERNAALDPISATGYGIDRHDGRAHRLLTGALE